MKYKCTKCGRVERLREALQCYRCPSAASVPLVIEIPDFSAGTTTSGSSDTVYDYPDGGGQSGGGGASGNFD